MNVYAVVPQYAPDIDVQFLVQRDDQAALDSAAYFAAADAVHGYGSPKVEVYLVAELRHVGDIAVADIVDRYPWAADAAVEVAAREVIHNADRKLGPR